MKQTRIDKLFAEQKERNLAIYYTAGFPSLNDTLPILKDLEKAGADLVEIGIPFSDPIADGPTIQASSTQALNNGMTLNFLFEQLKDMRTEVQIPVVLMGYLNPVWQFGLENFCKACADCGIDGVILPDLPYNEYAESFKATFEEYNIQVIFLISPQTSERRIMEVSHESTGFLYMVSSASITGTKKGIKEGQIEYFERIQKLNLSIPKMIGFGVSTQQSFDTVCQYASGAIIGSAFIKRIAESEDLSTDIHNFVIEIKGKNLNNL